MGRDRLQTLGDSEAVALGRDDEGGQSLRARRLAGAGEDGVHIRDAAIGDPRLAAVQHELITVAFRRHGQIGDVGA